MLRKIFFLLCIILLSTAYAVPAFSMPREYRQSDGTTFIATPRGDEFLHYLESQDKRILKYNNKSKEYDYATIRNERLAPSGIRYVPPSKQKSAAAATVTPPPKITQEELQLLRKKAIERFKKGSPTP